MQTKSHRRNYNEVLLGNRVDNAFNRLLLPINVLRQITFDQKYRIRDKFITSNDNINNLATFCVLICTVSINSYQQFTFDFMTSKLVRTITNIIELVIVPIVLLINFAYTVHYSNTHVLLFLKLQRLAKFTKYSKYKNFIIFSWVGVIMLVGFHSSLMILWCVNYQMFLWSQLIRLWIHSYIFYFFLCVNLLKSNVVFWTDNLKQLEKKICTRTEEENEITNQINTESFADLFNYFSDILEAFSILTRTFEFMVRIK